jgi:hypothetical protein
MQAAEILQRLTPPCEKNILPIFIARVAEWYRNIYSTQYLINGLVQTNQSM